MKPSIAKQSDKKCLGGREKPCKTKGFVSLGREVVKKITEEEI